MKRALFSNEAGQGSSPIAHSAAKTDEPVREAVVAGLEPFIDTIVVCTLTALVILTSGIWNRTPDHVLEILPTIAAVDGEVDTWTLTSSELPEGDWQPESTVYTVVAAERNEQTGNNLQEFTGTVKVDAAGRAYVEWGTLVSEITPTHDSAMPDVTAGGIYRNYKGATLTAKAFDTAVDGLGKWLVTLAAWLFAISTMISWSYYGEQGMVYLLGDRSVLPYKLVYCLLIVAACVPQLVQTDAQLDALTSLGTGVMLWANIPIMLLFGYQAMNAYHRYMGKLKAGQFHPHAAPSITDVIEGKDVE